MGQGKSGSSLKPLPSVSFWHSTCCCHALRPWSEGLEKEPGKRTGHKSCLELTDVEGKAVMHPVLFWIAVSCFILFFFFHFWGFPTELFIVSCWLFGPISNIKIPQLWACVLPPCETSQLKPAGLWGGLSCFLLPDNFTSYNSFTHSFFSSKDKSNFSFSLHRLLPN